MDFPEGKAIKQPDSSGCKELCGHPVGNRVAIRRFF
jgi:hypothetical protein